MASLFFQAGPNAGRRFKLGAGDYIIGRRSDCQIFVPDMRVSRQHARLRREGDVWQVEDLGSNNGTYVNGKRVALGQVKHDDEIMIANNRIRVEIPESKRDSGTYDANVTVVDLRNPKVFVDNSSSSGAGSPSDANFHSSTSTVGATDERRELRLLERKLNALTSLLENAATTTDPVELLDKIVEALLDVFPAANSVGVLVEDEHSGELKVQTKRHRQKSFGSDLRVPGTIIRHVVEDRRGILLQGEDTSASESVPGRKRKLHGKTALVEAIAPGAEPAGARMGAPLQSHGENYGAIYVEGKGQSFRQEDVSLLSSIAAQAGLAIHATRQQQQKAVQRRLDRDLQVARQIQRSLLPSDVPDVKGMSFGVHYEPAYQIGGDFYDFIWHDKDHLGMAIGDVSGKGISAAMYMASLTSQLRSRGPFATSPGKLLSKVNESMLHLGDDGMFATLAYMIYDLPSRTLVFTNAGHMVPLLRRDGRIYPIESDEAHGTPIGILDGATFGEARIQLEPGDVVILCTDGVHEARNAASDEYGVKRLSQRIRSGSDDAHSITEEILEDIDVFVGNGPQTDDITLLAFGISSDPAKRRKDTQTGVSDMPD